MTVDSFNNPLFTEEEVFDIVEEASFYFSPICMSFSSCEYQVIDVDYSLGRIRDTPITIANQYEELSIRYSKRRRINIFFVDFIDDRLCGDATFEGILSAFNANIYIEQDCEDKPSGQLAHQLGHLFGLRDTYDSETIELVDGSNCTTTGDFLCDTPADPFEQEFISVQDSILLAEGQITDEFLNDNCEFIYEVRDPNTSFYQPDVGNIMSGYPCRCGFSRSQYLLIVENYLKSTVAFF